MLSTNTWLDRETEPYRSTWAVARAVRRGRQAYSSSMQMQCEVVRSRKAWAGRALLRSTHARTALEAGRPVWCMHGSSVAKTSRGPEGRGLAPLIIMHISHQPVLVYSGRPCPCTAHGFVILELSTAGRYICNKTTGRPGGAEATAATRTRTAKVDSKQAHVR